MPVFRHALRDYSRVVQRQRLLLVDHYRPTTDRGAVSRIVKVAKFIVIDDCIGSYFPDLDPE